MKTLYLIALVVLSFGAAAQKLRITDSTNHWVTVGDCADCPFFSLYYSYGSDTIIAGNHYRVLTVTPWFPPRICPGGCSNFSAGFVLREDTITNKVYYRYLNVFASPDPLEHVLYDYSLNAGDSISYPSFTPVPMVDSIVSIDSTLINGVYHKIQNIQNKSTSGGGSRAYSVVEGLGTTNGPVLPAFFIGCFEYEERLACFSQDTTYPLIHAPCNPAMCNPGALDSFVNSVGCTYVLTEDSIYQPYYGPIYTTNTIKPNEAVTFDPNPADNYLRVKAGSSFGDNTMVTIYDITGRPVFQSALPPKNAITINTSSLSEGLYIVFVQSSNGSAIQKIVVVH